MNLFEIASRKQYRFNGAKGTLSSEDLWDLNLESLDVLAKGLNKELKNSEEESFIAKKTIANTDLNNKFEIVKHIITVRLAEAERKKLNKQRAEKRAELIELIGKKEKTDLESKSIDELKAQLAELDEV